jgi:predicted metallo-beta-lactamase superfamily hydrolase
VEATTSARDPTEPTTVLIAAGSISTTRRKYTMPEASNCELYKLESKLEEITLVIKRAQEQLERIKNGTTTFLDDSDEHPISHFSDDHYPPADYEEPRT